MLGRGGCPSVWADRSQRRPLFQRGDVCCTRQQTVDFCAVPFLRFRQCGSCRQARALDPATLRLASHRGRKVEGGALREQRLRAESAQVVRSSALGRRPTRREKVRERVLNFVSVRTIKGRSSLRGKHAPAEFPGQAIARESTLDKRRRRYGRAGVHTEIAWKQTRRQRFGVTPEGVHARRNARCVPVF